MSKPDRAAIKIQSMIRMFVKKKKYNEKIVVIRYQSRKAIIIQCCWRCHEARHALKNAKFESQEREKMKRVRSYKSAVKIESFFRMVRDRHITQLMKTGQLEKSKSAKLIQKFYRKYYAKMDLRGMKGMKMVLDHYKRQIGMAKHLEVRIAPLKIFQFPKTDVHTLHRADIRQIYDFGIKMKTEDDYLDIRINAAVKFQSIWRRHVAKKNFKKLVYYLLIFILIEIKT